MIPGLGGVLGGVLEEVKIVCSGINGKQQIVGSDLTQENLKGIKILLHPTHFL